VAVGRAVVDAGDSTEVVVRYTVRQSGPVLKSVKLLTNDPTCPVAYLTVRGDVPYDLAIHPDRLYVVYSRESPRERTLRLTGPVTMDVTRAYSARGAFTAWVAPGGEAQQGQRRWEVAITISPTLPLGITEDELRVETTHPRRPLVVVPVAIEVQPQVLCRPPDLFFGFVAVGHPITRTAVLRLRDGGRFTVLASMAEAAAVHCRASRAADDRWEVAVRLDPSETGVIETSLLLRTDVAGEETIRIPVYAHVIPR
jgi:hypothetical protein